MTLLTSRASCVNKCSVWKIIMSCPKMTLILKRYHPNRERHYILVWLHIQPPEALEEPFQTFDERDAKYVKKKIMNVIYSQPFIFFKISAFFSRSSRFQRSLLPERGLENLSRGALFGVIVVAIKKVSKHSLVGWNVCSFPTVYRVWAGIR